MRGMVAGVVCLAVGLGAAAAPDSKAAVDLRKEFGEIRGELASADFAEREAGQKRLEAVPASQLEVLRGLAKDEGDPEVKARLDGRIKALESYRLTHPTTISLHVKDAGLGDVVTGISKQLGDMATVRLDNSGERGIFANFDFDADDLPFWDAMLKLQKQAPFSIRTGQPSSFPPAQMYLSRTANPPISREIDGFLITPQISSSPMAPTQDKTATWSIRLACIADPRVRLTGYTRWPRVTKVTDQDGRSILRAVVETEAPTVSFNGNPSSITVWQWASDINLTPAPGVTALKDLRLDVEVAILEKVTTVLVDLTKPLEPVQTSRGLLLVEKDAKGVLDLGFPIPPRDPAAKGIGAMFQTAVRVLDANGERVAEAVYTTLKVGRNNNQNVGMTQGSKITLNARAAKLELTWPEKTQAYTVPVELHDIPVALAGRN